MQARALAIINTLWQKWNISVLSLDDLYPNLCRHLAPISGGTEFQDTALSDIPLTISSWVFAASCLRYNFPDSFKPFWAYINRIEPVPRFWHLDQSSKHLPDFPWTAVNFFRSKGPSNSRWCNHTLHHPINFAVEIHWVKAIGPQTFQLSLLIMQRANNIALMQRN